MMLAYKMFELYMYQYLRKILRQIKLKQAHKTKFNLEITSWFFIIAGLENQIFYIIFTWTCHHILVVASDLGQV